MQCVILSTDTLYEVGSLSAMWIVMMAIMMFPTTAPWLIAVRNISTSSPMRTVPMFLGGYLFIWMLFSFGAAIMQHLLHKAALASHMGHPVTPYVGAALLALAGLFQLTALKRRCLAHCQSPVSFFLTRWRDGRLGALQMGVHHGVYCLGCCWALMLLAFVSGVMSRDDGTFNSLLGTGKNLDRFVTRPSRTTEAAITHYRVLRRMSDTTLVEVILGTGRRNQIRVHFADAGHPVLGDPRYNTKKAMHPRWIRKRIALHAKSLGFKHPVSGKAVTFESPLPSALENFLVRSR